MDYGHAADVRDTLNGQDYVQGPDDDSDGSYVFQLARVHQTGYLNGDPFFEVLLTPKRTGDSVHLVREFVDWVSDRDFYLRVDDGGDVHVRDVLGDSRTN